MDAPGLFPPRSCQAVGNANTITTAAGNEDLLFLINRHAKCTCDVCVQHLPHQAQWCGIAQTLHKPRPEMGNGKTSVNQTDTTVTKSTPYRHPVLGTLVKEWGRGICKANARPKNTLSFNLGGHIYSYSRSAPAIGTAAMAHRMCVMTAGYGFHCGIVISSYHSRNIYPCPTPQLSVSTITTDHQPLSHSG